MDSFAQLAGETPEQVELKLLAGRIVWLREGPMEWTGPAEEALERIRALAPDAEFWAAFG